MINKSNKRIYWGVFWDYPNKQISGNSIVNLKSQTLQINGSYKYQIGKPKYSSCWEYIFKQKEKENIYFFDADIIEKTAWSEVQKNNIGLLERREIDLDYCIKNNWQVIYK